MSRATGRIWLPAFAALILLSGMAGAQEAPSSSAFAYADAVRERGGSAYAGPFLDAFLGSNREAGVPELSRLMTELTQARTERARTEALAAYRGDRETLDAVLDLAAREARVWKPGRVLRRETVNRLWGLLYRGPPTGRRELRVESYEPPAELREWIFTEQKVNEKISDGDVRDGSLPRELNPKNGAQFWLPHVEIPIEEARVMEAGGIAPEIRSQLVVRRDGKTYVRYFIHPGSSHSKGFQGWMEQYGVKVEFLAMPTSSPRSLAVWNPHTNDRFFLAKVSLDAEVGGLRRINSLDKGMRAVTVTRALDAYYAKHLGGRAPPFLREPMVVFAAGREFGQILREPPAEFPGTRGRVWVPGCSLISRGPDGKPPLLVRLIRKHRTDPVKFTTEKLIAPLMSLYGEVALRQGLAGEPHQQNVLFEVGRNGEFTGRVMFRDLDSYKPDVELRLRNGLGMRSLAAFPDPGTLGHLKLSKGRVYHDTSYLAYVRGDWTHMFYYGLRRYFPNVSKAELGMAFDLHYAAELKRNLGNVPFETGERPNDIVARYRREARETQTPARMNAGIPQKMLREEYARLQFNRRVLWIGGTARPTPKHTMVLHDGVIEMRGGNDRVLGFAFLEPPGSKDFYRAIRFSRKEPDPGRLRKLYAAAARAATRHPDRGNGWIGREAKSTGHFLGAYLFKEVLVAAENAHDPKRFRQAVASMWSVEFAKVTGLFTVASRITEVAVGRIPGNGVGKNLGKSVLPLMAGTAAVQWASGNRSKRDLMITTASYFVSGVVVNVALGGGAKGTVSMIVRSGIALWGGEKLERFLHRRFDEPPVVPVPDDDPKIRNPVEPAVRRMSGESTR